LAVCGAGHKALELLKEVPASSGISSAILVRAADAAIQQEAGGKSQIPVEVAR